VRFRDLSHPILLEQTQRQSQPSPSPARSLSRQQLRDAHNVPINKAVLTAPRKLRRQSAIPMLLEEKPVSEALLASDDDSRRKGRASPVTA
jgi:C4-dicarboxylate-specific signal transduction histidine kinase